MKASVQYDDFVGTAAADISDHTDLGRFLESKGVDIERYEAIGASFYFGENNYFSAAIICIDNEESSEKKKHIIKMRFEKKFTYAEFFNLFKRFNVVVSSKYGDYENLDIDDEIYFDDRN